MVNGVTYGRAHLATTQFSQFSTGQTLQYPQDSLVVFGNLGVITNVRDIGINSVPGGADTSSGEGLTIQREHFCLDALFCLEPQSKYVINWTWTRDGNNPGTLTLSRDTSGKKADRAQPLNITVTTNDPMTFKTTPQGDVQDSLQIKLTSKSPFNNYTTWLDWQNPNTISPDKTTWNFFVPPPSSRIIPPGLKTTPQSSPFAAKIWPGTT